ncbi:hypothetical protein GJAV_G00258240 [Gymnothorax javanicus]|nr:hypothetical protein GJAV_G00258240 [Gymnothorax javanicus]
MAFLAVTSCCAKFSVASVIVITIIALLTIRIHNSVCNSPSLEFFKMHHSESAGDSASIRKMAHPAIFPRRGSNTGSSNVSASALTTAANANVSNNIISTDDYQSPLVIQPPPPAGSSSPGPQHHPQSLNLLSQSQLHSQTLQVGAQVKKKSGFQITSVTPAQISVSTNNSITEDTESCDDLDESHTEDLSSSEILDVSLSRATDMGGPERSSSEETLNNFHEAETPGASSPNQPPHPLSHGTHVPMVNGTAHHPPPHQHGHSHHPNLGHHRQAAPSQPVSGLPVGGGISFSGSSASGAQSGTTQKLPPRLVASTVNTHINKSVSAQPVATSSSGTGAPSIPVVAASNVANPTFSNESMSSGRNLSTGLASIKSGGTVVDSSSVGVNLMQQQTGVQGAGMTAAGVGTAGMMRPGVGSVTQPPIVTSVPPQQAPASAPNPTPAPAPPPASTSSRFRVVKLDSNFEPFRKGRWTCTEYYDKEAPPQEGAASTHRAAPADALRSGQPVADGATGVLPVCENDGAEGQQAFQPIPGVQIPLRAHVVQDPGPPKPSAAQPAPSMVGVLQPQQGIVNQGAQQPAAMPQQQLAYAQAGQSAQPGYPPSAQQPAATHIAPAHAMTAPQQQPVAQVGVRAPHAHQPAGLASGAVPVSMSSSQPAVSVPSASAQAIPQGHQHLATQAPIITQPRPPASVPPEQQQQQLPPSSQGPPPPTAAVTLSQAPPSGLPLERKPSPAQVLPSFSSAQALPSLSSAQLEDAQRFLFQHQSLLSLPKLGAGECASAVGSAPAQEDSGGASALPAGAGLFPLKSLPVDGEEDSSSGASVVAIDNKIEQAMDLVKSHLMYAVREEVEVLKEQIKELIERNSQLEQENNLLKNLASPEQLAQFQAQVQSGSPPPSAPPAGTGTQQTAPSAQSAAQSTGPSA